MQILKVDPLNPLNEHLTQVVDILSKGGIVILPTETVYTIAVDATSKDAVEKVYRLKGRGFNKPLHVVLPSLEMARIYVEVTPEAYQLADRFLPGPLTLILPQKGGVLPGILTSGIPTLGIRIPGLPLCLEIAKMFGKPYTTTSANLSGSNNPYSIKQVLKSFEKHIRDIGLVVDIGELPRNSPSTLLDLTSKPPKILRQGPITQKQIEEVLFSK